jgi:hypothetical protein
MMQINPGRVDVLRALIAAEATVTAARGRPAIAAALRGGLASLARYAGKPDYLAAWRHLMALAVTRGLVEHEAETEATRALVWGTVS